MFKTMSIALTTTALLVSGSFASAQSDGNTVPNQQRGRSISPVAPRTGNVNGPASRGAGTDENKPSATGGQPDGGADNN